jgi:hypothetical protein
MRSVTTIARHEQDGERLAVVAVRDVESIFGFEKVPREEFQ